MSDTTTKAADLRPLYEGDVMGTKLFVTVYAATCNGLDVLAWEARRNAGRVDLGLCVFAGRWRDGAWRSRTGRPNDADLRALAKHLRALEASRSIVAPPDDVRT